ncbi:MAG: helix-turn-helix transcriptional regulator [Terracidiphilus sp.]|jgi:DNA-binding XRE family transcriptional regulator
MSVAAQINFNPLNNPSINQPPIRGGRTTIPLSLISAQIKRDVNRTKFIRQPCKHVYHIGQYVSRTNTFALLTDQAVRCDSSRVRSEDFEKTFYSTFGAMLAAARQKCRVSQEALAEELGLTRTSITNIEKGRQPLQLHSLYLVAQSLSLDVKDLLPSPAALKMAQPPTNLSVSNAEWLKTMDLKMPQGAVTNGKGRGPGKTIARK